MDSERSSIEEFVSSAFITATVTPADDDPDLYLWRVLMRRPGNRQMTVYFSHKGDEPSVVEVLDRLASESIAIDEAGSFEAWARYLGHDTDSRKAHRTYMTCKRQAERLRKFLDAGYGRLLNQTERM